MSSQDDTSLNEQLVTAIRSDDFREVKSLIFKGADVNAIHKEQREDRNDFSDFSKTPLSIAAELGNADIVRILLHNKALVEGALALDQENFHDLTPLAWASWKGHTEVVQELLAHGADPNLSWDTPWHDDPWGAWSAFHSACMGGHREVVTLLVDAGADVHARNIYDETVLHSVCARGPNPVEAARLLLDHGADIESIVEMDLKGTPLMWACYYQGQRGDDEEPQSEDEELVALLLERGANVNYVDDDGYTALHSALRTYRGPINCGILELLLKKGADVGAWTWRCSTPLTLASSIGHLEAARIIIKHGADINGYDEQGEFPLKAATRNGHVEIVRFLLEHGADINQSSDDLNVSDCWEEHTALMAACYNDQTKIAFVLLEHGADPNLCHPVDQTTPLMVSAAKNNVELVEALLAHEALLHPHDTNRWHALVHACNKGATITASLLIESGLGPDTGITAPLMLACANGHQETAEMLIEKGADIHAVSNTTGATLLIEALQKGHEAVSRMLIDRGVPLLSETPSGVNRLAARRLISPDDYDTPGIGWDQPSELMWASFWGFHRIVEILLNKGADLDAWDGAGRTALMIASGEGHVEIVKTLLKHNASVNAQDADGLTALMWAACWGKAEAVKILVDAPTQLDITDRLGNTALDWASRAGHESLCEILLSRGATCQKTEEKPDIALLIRQAYPFPLAYPYRLIDNNINPMERYRQMLRLGENIMAFLGSVILAIAKANNLQPPANLLKDSWQGGISPGSWLQVFHHVLDMLDTQTQDPVSKAFSALWWKGRGRKESDFSKALRKVASVKNDFKHDRGPDSQREVRRACDELQETLTVCMNQLAFCVYHPIRLIIDMDVDQQTSSIILTCFRLAGDHTVFPKEEVNYSKALPRNSLHMQITEGAWIPLYPFLTVQECPKCGHTEVYFIDRWDGKDRPATLKSFERGHDLESPEVGMALGEWLEAT